MSSSSGFIGRKCANFYLVPFRMGLNFGRKYRSVRFFAVLVRRFRAGGKWSRRPELNRRPTDYESVALPTELRRPAPASILQGLLAQVKTAELIPGFTTAQTRGWIRLEQSILPVKGENRESCCAPQQPFPQRSSFGRGKATDAAWSQLRMTAGACQGKEICKSSYL